MPQDYSQISAHMSRIISCPSLTRIPATRILEKSDQCSVPQLPNSNHQQKPLMEPVAILWDIENCPVPGDVSADDVAGNIRMAIRVHPAVEGVVTMFSAYGDFNHFPRRLREGCQRTGINLIDVPNGKKDASDKAILVDMFLFALDNPPPCTILLISGDVDFAPALHKLGQRGYTVVLAIPAGIGVSSALCNAGRYVWDWPSVARGEGFVPAKAFLARSVEERLPDNSGAPSGISWQSGDDSDHLPEDERCGYGRHNGPGIIGGLGNGVTHHDFSGLAPNQHPRQGGMMCATGTQPLKNQVPYVSFAPLQQSHSHVPEPPNKRSAPVTSRPQQPNGESVSTDACKSWIQPGDIEGLKHQLIKLLKIHGGELVFVRVPSEYCKVYGRPLYLSEYGSPKLAHLIERMQDAFMIKGEGGRRKLCLKEKIPRQVSGECEADKLLKQNSARNVTTKVANAAIVNDIDLAEEVILLRGSDNDEATDDNGDREEQDGSSSGGNSTEAVDLKVQLEVFKQELQELLVSHACRIPMTSFLRLYQQRYSRNLDVQSLGVSDINLLFDKVKDVAVVKIEQGTNRKFLVAKM